MSVWIHSEHFSNTELKWIYDSMADDFYSEYDLLKSYYAVLGEYYEVAYWYILL